MPHTRCRCGKPRHAIAMTTALSPDSRMLIHMILASAIQNSVWPMSFQPELTSAHQLAGSISCAIEPTCLSSHAPRSYARGLSLSCLLYTSDAADERSSVDLGGRR